jgi:TonB family protein
MRTRCGLALVLLPCLLAILAAVTTAAQQPPSTPDRPSGGSGAVMLDVSDFPFAWYLAAINRKVTERWEGRALQGRQPVVTFEIARDGQVSNLAVKDSSSNPYYDRTAMRAIAEAAPFPRLPEEFRGEAIKIVMGFNFAPDRDGAARITTVPTEGIAEECEKRKAIAANLSTIESAARAAKGTTQQTTLLAQMADIEKRIAELQPVMYGGCPDDLAIAVLSDRLEKASDPIRRAVAAERRRQEVGAKPWPEKIKRAVLEERIEIGMTAEQVSASWGRAQRVNETITATTRQEQWIYPGSMYLYFTNGTLTTIQRSR